MVFYKLKDKSVNNSELSNLVNLESHFFFLLIPRNANYFSTSHRCFHGSVFVAELWYSQWQCNKQRTGQRLPFFTPLSVINVQILILHSWKTSIAKVSPTRPHGNSYIFYKVANSYEFIRPHSYKFIHNFTIRMNLHEWPTPNPAPKPTSHWGLDKLYKIVRVRSYELVTS